MTKLATVAAHDHDVAKQVEKTTALLGPQLPSATFVTMGLCRYFPESGELQWCRAGHPPALLVRRSGECKLVTGEGFPIGFVDQASYEVQREHLELGDVVLLVTDGVTEVQNRAMQVFGTDRLVEVLRRSGPDAGAAQLVTDVVDAIDTFREGRMLKDDVTLVLLKRLA
jgi:sigma-B regulation protein RsbU (phosphoserine phosphatase)